MNRGPRKPERECPLGGDTANDCEGCPYSGDYYYDPESGDCVARPDNETPEETYRRLYGEDMPGQS